MTPFDYRYYVYTVVHQWALINGWSGANILSLRAWLRLPASVRKDFRATIMAGGEL
jgi:hypothetical protein